VALGNEAQDGAHQAADVLLAVHLALHPLQQGAALAQLHDHVHVGVVLKHVVEVDCVEGHAQLLHHLHLRTQLQEVPVVGVWVSGVCGSVTEGGG
jgi:hypothetical protein